MDFPNKVTRSKKARFSPGVRRFTHIAAGALLASASSWWTFRVFHPAPPNHLLASAYSEQRTLELRFPGSTYAPLKVLRGYSERVGLYHPAALLEAEAAISRAMARDGEDAAWLQAKGRADVLAWNYGVAIKTLRRALELSADSTSLPIDLASAYFERAEAEARPIDYGQAIELLGRALDRNPDDPVALFNRAVSCERVHLYGQAVADLRNCLRLDREGGWAEDAKRRLDTLELRLQKLDRNRAQLDASPTAFLGQLNDSSAERCANRPELHLQRSLVDWLPTGFPVDANAATRSSLQAARKALKELAAALLETHRDSWMKDLLTCSSSPVFASATRELSAALHANAEGDPDRALACSRRAAVLFRSSRCEAGALRADFETVYALQRSAQGAACAAGAGRLANALKPHSWGWCKAQADLELASCLSMIGELGEALKAADRATEATQAAGYRLLRLRSLGIRASLDSDAGNFAAAWAVDQAGLGEYWADAYPTMRAYQFYDDMAVFAEEFTQWHLALVLAREAVAAMTSTGNRSSEAIARRQLARMAVMAGAVHEAEREFSRAEELFAGLPQSEAVEAYRMDGEIGMARLEILRGETIRASTRLLGIRNRLHSVANYPMALDFYRAWTEIEHRANPADQEKYLRAVVAIAEHGLSSIENPSERLHWLRQADQSYRGLVFRAWSRGEFRRALELWEWYRGAALRLPRVGHEGERANSGIDFQTLGNGPPLPELSAVSEASPHFVQQTVISYAELTGGVAVWVYDDRGVSTHWVATPDRSLQKTARRFANGCADPGSDIAGIRTDGKYLYQQLIAPIAGLLKPERTLVFELDGDLTRVPIQALITPSGEYLGAVQSITHSPGLNYLRRLRVPDLMHAGNALVVGSPALSADLAESFEPLPDATAEAQSVASRFQNAVLLTGRQATIGAVMRALPDANVFHFAGHSVARAGDASLLLAGEYPDRPHPSEIPVLRPSSLKPRTLAACTLVVLSACSTEKLPDDALADPRNVAVALLGARVPHVVASAWNIDSRATAAFMNTFYETLLSTGSVTGSLRSAERAISRQAATAHPYYWAAFNSWGQI